MFPAAWTSPFQNSTSRLKDYYDSLLPRYAHGVWGDTAPCVELWILFFVRFFSSSPSAFRKIPGWLFKISAVILRSSASSIVLRPAPLTRGILYLFSLMFLITRYTVVEGAPVICIRFGADLSPFLYSSIRNSVLFFWGHYYSILFLFEFRINKTSSLITRLYIFHFTSMYFLILSKTFFQINANNHIAQHNSTRRFSSSASRFKIAFDHNNKSKYTHLI